MTNPLQNGSIKNPDLRLRVLFWKAGGLNDTKFLEFQQSVYQADADIYFIVEAGAATEKPDWYQTNGYTKQQLTRSRQVASGILIGIKNGITANLKVLHEIEDADKLEAVHVELWKNKQYFSIVNLYNPQRASNEHP